MKSYNRIAWLYDTLARWVFLGNILKSQAHFLPLIKANDRILIIGGGSGLILKAMDQLEIPIAIDFIEPSSRMIEKAKKHALKAINLKVRFHQIGFESFKSKENFNTICCFFFLDLFKEQSLKSHLNHINNLINEKSYLLVSDFQNIRGKWWQIGLAKMMHVFFKLTAGLESNNLKDINNAIEKSGFVNISQADFFSKFIFSAVYQKEVSKNGNHS